MKFSDSPKTRELAKRGAGISDAQLPVFPPTPCGAPFLACSPTTVISHFVKMTVSPLITRLLFFFGDAKNGANMQIVKPPNGGANHLLNMEH